MRAINWFSIVAIAICSFASGTCFSAGLTVMGIVCLVLVACNAAMIGLNQWQAQ